MSEAGDWLIHLGTAVVPENMPTQVFKVAAFTKMHF
jgi:hypothetical protein